MITFADNYRKYSLTQNDLAWWGGKLTKYSQFTLQDVERKVASAAFAHRITSLVSIISFCKIGTPSERTRFVKLLQEAKLCSPEQLAKPIWSYLKESPAFACQAKNEEFALELLDTPIYATWNTFKMAIRNNMKGMVARLLQSLKTRKYHDALKAHFQNFVIEPCVQNPTNDMMLFVLDFFEKHKNFPLVELLNQDLLGQIVREERFSSVEQRAEVIKRLIALGVDGRMILREAVRDGNYKSHPALVKELLATIEPSNSEVARAFHAACKEHLVEIATIFLELDPQPLSPDDLRGGLAFAMISGYADIAELILKKNSSIVEQTILDSYFPPSHVTVHGDYDSLFVHLLETEGGKRVAADPPPKLLHNMIARGYLEAIKKLLSLNPAFPHLNFRGDRNLGGYVNSTPLGIACAGGHWKIVSVLLQAGAKPDLPEQRGYSPFIYVTHNHKICVLLVDAYLKEERPLEEKLKFLGLLVEKIWAHDGSIIMTLPLPPPRNPPNEEQIASIRYLLRLGVTEQHLTKSTLDAMAEYGMTELHTAARSGDIAQCRALLGACATQEERDKLLDARSGLVQEKTPLMLAQENGHAEVVGYFLEGTYTHTLLIQDEAGKNERRVPINASILEKRSAYFKRLLSGGFNEEGKTLIPITYQDPETFEMIVNFFQTGALVIDRKTFIPLAAATNMFVLDDLAKRLRAWCALNPDCAKWEAHLLLSHE